MRGNTVKLAAEALADAAGVHGISVTVVYRVVTASDGRRLFTTSLNEAFDQRITAGDGVAEGIASVVR
jgi:hypothetical protein